MLKRYMQSNERVLLVGPPGISKTARILKASADCSRKPIVMRAGLCERVDFGGCLVPDQKSGVTRALPLELLKELRETKEPTLLFLDDLGQAPIDVQAALMRLFDSGELSDQVLIWGATNRPGDKAGVTALCEPLRSRFHLAFAMPTPDGSDKPDGASMLGTWKDFVDGWTDWALENSAPAEVIAWHRWGISGTCSVPVVPVLYGWKPAADPGVRFPDFRSWATVIRLWNAGLRDLSTISASIGKGQASAFLAFAATANELPSVDQIKLDPDGSPVPKDPGALYLITSMVAGAIDPSWTDQMLQYLDRMPRVFGALLTRDCYKKLGAKLSGSKRWCQWFQKNQCLFTTG